MKDPNPNLSSLLYVPLRILVLHRSLSVETQDAPLYHSKPQLVELCSAWTLSTFLAKPNKQKDSPEEQ